MAEKRTFTIEFPTLVVDSAMPIGGKARSIRIEVEAEDEDDAVETVAVAITDLAPAAKTVNRRHVIQLGHLGIPRG